VRSVHGLSGDMAVTVARPAPAAALETRVRLESAMRVSRSVRQGRCGSTGCLRMTGVCPPMFSCVKEEKSALPNRDCRPGFAPTTLTSVYAIR
jgi:hypothetical protein